VPDRLVQVRGTRVGAERIPMEQKKSTGTPYGEMRPKQKAFFLFKLVICILTFGMAFPNVMSD
jgi:hypothetical protein